MSQECWKIIGLHSPIEPNKIRWIGLSHTDIRFDEGWRVVWRYKDRLQSKLALYFRELEARGLEPIETDVFGGVVALEGFGAMRMCRFFVEILRGGGQCDLNWWSNGDRRRRSVVTILNDEIIHYPSLRAAAKSLGVYHWRVTEMLHQGKGCYDAS